MPTLATRISEQLAQVTPPTPPPTQPVPTRPTWDPHRRRRDPSPPFRQNRRLLESWRLWNNLTTLLSHEQDILHRFTPNAAPGTSTGDQGSLGDKDRLIPLDKLVER